MRLVIYIYMEAGADILAHRSSYMRELMSFVPWGMGQQFGAFSNRAGVDVSQECMPHL